MADAKGAGQRGELLKGLGPLFPTTALQDLEWGKRGLLGECEVGGIQLGPQRGSEDLWGWIFTGWGEAPGRSHGACQEQHMHKTSLT